MDGEVESGRPIAPSSGELAAEVIPAFGPRAIRPSTTARFVLAALGAVTLAGLIGAVAGAASSATEAVLPPVRVTQSPAVQRVTLGRRGELVITLTNNSPTGGFVWEFTTKASARVLTLLSNKLAPLPPLKHGITSVPQPRTITYRAAGVGTTRIDLILKVTSHSPAKPAGKLDITVHVVAKFAGDR